MGKQINFLHTEEDILPFLTLIEKHHGQFLSHFMLFQPVAVSSQIIAAMSIHKAIKYEIVHVPDKALAASAKHLSSRYGTAIEFVNCEKTGCDSYAYEVGRLFICVNEQGIYESQVLSLYTRLCYYIKKHYIRHQRTGIYLSPRFNELYEKGAICATQAGGISLSLNGK